MRGVAMALFPVYVSKQEFHKFLLLVDQYAAENNTSRSALVVSAVLEHISKGVKDRGYNPVVTVVGKQPDVDSVGRAADICSSAGTATTIPVGYIR